MSLQQMVAEVFAPDGLLSRALEEFTPRSGQTEMASAIARTIEHSGVLVVEAGTGIGKTFSYLVPALLSGQRVLVSTATKTLQDQLFRRDIPRLVEALGLPVKTALLKGRSSYLCLHRMQEARQHPLLEESRAQRTLARIELWAQGTRSGDMAELPGLDERSPLIPLVTSSRDNCLGAGCPQFRNCHVNLARREALAAEIVVINHHLFFADLAVRESGMAELLPTVNLVIFDEAHQLNETGVQFLGSQLSTGQLLDFARDLLQTCLQHARGLLDWHQLAQAVEMSARDWRMLLGKTHPGTKLRWTERVPEGLNADDWDEALEAVRVSCTLARVALDTVTEISPELQRLSERAATLVAQLERFSQAGQVGTVRWLDVGTQLRLVESPLDIAQTVQEKLIKTQDATQTQRAWIFTSATLGSDATLSRFTEPCGLESAEILKIGSPFDYEKQAAFYVPQDLVKPSDPAHSAQVAALVARSASMIGGRTLVLTTTLRALSAVSEALEAHFSATGQLEVLVQGQQPKGELMTRFRQANQDGQRGCILVASASFWEGVDVPGEALQLVVIDKLPFPPPSDPLVEARSKRLEAEGRSVFNDYFMPEATLALKQGAGRLIRRESDRGILVVCDTRLVQMGYGRRLVKALPPMRRLQTPEDLAQALEALTRPSTTDLCWP
jgi:ATP-dependent DNA helicase DinG